MFGAMIDFSNKAVVIVGRLTMVSVSDAESALVVRGAVLRRGQLRHTGILDRLAKNCCKIHLVTFRGGKHQDRPVFESYRSLPSVFGGHAPKNYRNYD